MALDETMKAAPAPQEQEGQLTDDEEQDLKIAVLFAEKLIDEGGIEIIDKAVEESNDPGQVIGQFLMQLVSQLSEKLPQEMQLSKRIYFAHGGWIEQISDYLQEQYDIDKKIMDRAEMYIGAAAQKMSQGAGQPGGQPAAPAQPVGRQPISPMPGGM